MNFSMSFCKRAFRVFGLVVGVVLFFIATESDCNAQLFRRHRLSRQSVASGAFAGTKVKIQQSGLRRLLFGSSQQNRAFGYDPRVNPHAERYPRYPKYIGAFHSSHFSNIGVPSGDIGFRGNGIYWSPW